MLKGKLNEKLRSLILKAVLDDLPETDYRAEATELLQSSARTQMPKEVAKLYDDPELRGYLQVVRYNTHTFLGDVFLTGVKIYPKDTEDEVRERGFASEGAKMSFVPPKAVEAQVKLMGVKYREQQSRRYAIRTKVRNLLRECSTVDEVRKKMPEFARYLDNLHAPADKTTAKKEDILADLRKGGWKP